MIDAIRPIYSSNHGGRKKNLTTTQSFDRSVRGLGDSVVLKKAKQRDWGGLLFVSGGIAAISFIVDTLSNANQLSGPDTMKTISKNAAIWALIGGLFFGTFKSIERLCLGKG